MTEREMVYKWVYSCPFECHSYVDDNGNIIVTVVTNEQEEARSN
jgi:hypothetical protein